MKFLLLIQLLLFLKMLGDEKEKFEIYTVFILMVIKICVEF